MASKSLDLICQNNKFLIQYVKEEGLILKAGLVELGKKYPEIIKEVRGRGFLLGIEFHFANNLTKPDENPFFLMGIIAHQESLVQLKKKIQTIPNLIKHFTKNRLQSFPLIY